MAAPQFDLFAGAKGFEYANDQNQQDEDNEFKRRQNELALGAFEQQLREFAEGAALRKQTRENAMLTAQSNQFNLTNTFSTQQAHATALRSLSPALQLDDSALGGLNRIAAVQDHVRANSTNPATMKALGKEIGQVKVEALARAQYDPDRINEVLRHPLFGGELLVTPVDGKPGKFQISKRVPQGPGDPAAYVPIPYSEGPMTTVAASLQSMFPGTRSPDYGQTVGLKFDGTEFSRRRLESADTLAAQKVQLNATAGMVRNKTTAERDLRTDARAQDRNLTSQQRITAAAERSTETNRVRLLQTDIQSSMKALGMLQAERKELEAAITKQAPTADVRTMADLRTRLAGVIQKIADHTKDYGAIPWRDLPSMQKYAADAVGLGGEADDE